MVRHRKLDAPYRLVRQAFVMIILAGVIPQRQRALEPEQRPGLPLCRAHDGAGWLPPEQTGVLSVVSGDGEWLSTAGVLVARRGPAGERSPVVSP